MSNYQLFAWQRLGLTLALAFLFGLLAYATLLTLPAAAASFPNCGKELTPPPVGPDVFTVTGVVISAGGTVPVECVEVFAYSVTAKGRTYTDGDGHYSLTLSTGIYDFAFLPPLTSGLAYQARRGIRKAQVLDVTLPPGYLISGTVYSDLAKTKPVSNVNIFASNPDTFVGIGAMPTLTDGTYMLSLEEGPWELTFTPPHFLGLGPTRTMKIILTEDITQDVILPPGFTIAGQVTANNVGQANVDIFAQDPPLDGFGITATDANGFYTGTLPVGNYDILFFAPPFQGLGSTVITNVAGPPDVQRNVTLPAGHTVSGHITACSDPLANTFVHAAPQPPISSGRFAGWGRFSGTDGFYALALQPGDYILTPDPPLVTPPSPIVRSLAVTQDLTLDFNICLFFFPLLFKSRELVDNFDDGQDPNALGGGISTARPDQCPPTTISDGYDMTMPFNGPYSYRLAYQVTPTCYGVWQTELLDEDFSDFSKITFWIKGDAGSETPHIYLQDTDNCQVMPCRYFVNVGPFLPAGRITTNWQQAEIPLNVFTSNGVNTTSLRYFQIAFEFSTMTGAIYIDEIRFK